MFLNTFRGLSVERLNCFHEHVFSRTYHHDGVPDLKEKDGHHLDAFHERYGRYLWALGLFHFVIFCSVMFLVTGTWDTEM